MGEQQQKGLQGVVDLLSLVGEDPGREGLLKTPERVVKAYREMCSGYGADISGILSTTFDMEDGDGAVKYNGMVILKNIEFYSLCEHHMLPFVGTASVGYIPGPDGRVVGISKLARLVDAYARRLQCQERLTAQIANALHESLGASAVIVVMEAQHFCMMMRGVSKQGSVMITSEVRGVFRNDDGARQEALAMLEER